MWGWELLNCIGHSLVIMYLVLNRALLNCVGHSLAIMYLLPFVTFGISDELSSDGGPEFSSTVTKTFLKNMTQICQLYRTT